MKKHIFLLNNSKYNRKNNNNKTTTSSTTAPAATTATTMYIGLTFCPRGEDISEVDGPEGGVVLRDVGRPLLPELGAGGKP